MDIWTLIIRVGGGIFLLLILISGIKSLIDEIHLISLRNRICIILSFLILPLMFGTCTAINQLAPDKAHDVFGFKRHAVEERKGFETKSKRRERGFENIVEYFTSKHGWVSILCAIGAGGIFLIFLLTIVAKKLQEEPWYHNTGYLTVTAVIGILGLIVWSNS